ncbi:hypothetical protein FD755_024554 [Muntiacus reevesi]|uniref:Uncharacterized protein n=1 Tax=Muntiacus reevesi TaxID=9886 RepID=A0A5N3UW16_MUNRE|nr:hypothetical protein FD755_024554 [Muntiacus reevesi]
MATELRCPDSMLCHNQQVNSSSTQNPEPQQPGDLIPALAGGNSDSAAKLTLLSGHANSSVPVERDSQVSGGATLNSENNGGTGNYDAPASGSLLGDCEISRQIGAQLKLLPMNDQIRELQTIIRDKTEILSFTCLNSSYVFQAILYLCTYSTPFKVYNPMGLKYAHCFVAITTLNFRINYREFNCIRGDKNTQKNYTKKVFMTQIITMVGGDRIPVELFQVLKDDAVKVLGCTQYASKFWKTQHPLHYKEIQPVHPKGNQS